jgi:hypothetical protein
MMANVLGIAERRARRLLRNRIAIDRRPYEEKCNGDGERRLRRLG